MELIVYINLLSYELVNIKLSLKNADLQLQHKCFLMEILPSKLLCVQIHLSMAS